MRSLLPLLATLLLAQPLAPASLSPPRTRSRPVSRGTERTTASYSCIASWYGPGFAGRTMADGSPFDPEAMTCASRTLPMGTRLAVSRGEREVEVMVTDRGPFWPGRQLDLSREAAKAIGMKSVGVAAVRVEILR